MGHKPNPSHDKRLAQRKQTNTVQKIAKKAIEELSAEELAKKAKQGKPS